MEREGSRVSGAGSAWPGGTKILDPGAPAGLTGGFGAGLWGAGRGVGRGVADSARGGAARRDVAASGTGASGGHLEAGARCRVLPASCSSSHGRSLTPSLSSLHFHCHADTISSLQALVLAAVRACGQRDGAQALKPAPRGALCLERWAGRPGRRRGSLESPQRYCPGSRCWSVQASAQAPVGFMKQAFPLWILWRVRPGVLPVLGPVPDPHRRPGLFGSTSTAGQRGETGGRRPWLRAQPAWRRGRAWGEAAPA